MTSAANISPYTCVGSDFARNRQDITCPVCEAAFSMTERQWIRSKLFREPFACPVGHELMWPYSEQEKAIEDAVALFGERERLVDETDNLCEKLRKAEERIVHLSDRSYFERYHAQLKISEDARKRSENLSRALISEMDKVTSLRRSKAGLYGCIAKYRKALAKLKAAQ